MKTVIKEIKVGLDFGSGMQSVVRLAVRNSTIYFEMMKSYCKVIYKQKNVSLQASCF